ncbi:hypothetical protein QOT17_014882 [Balamuthia mandrillaris]
MQSETTGGAPASSSAAGGGSGGPLRHGQIMHIQEIVEHQQREESGTTTPNSLHNHSVRVMGTVVEFDVGRNRATLEYNGYTLPVDTSLLSQIPFHTGSLYQLIGELQNAPPYTLQVRVVRNVDGLDTRLYEETLKLRRQFEQEQANRQ